ncbi:hypothetical protein [Longispora albida]|uniref:hypothetical protein n=1 Tax=Longispora albida TaxID=203523 RepID=UPI0003610A1D|nr:hypothetical protein [Longispora albida]
MLDYLRIYSDAVRALLPAGEQPRAMGSFLLAYGENRVERTPEQIQALLDRMPGPVRREYERLLAGRPPEQSALDRIITPALKPLAWLDSLSAGPPGEIGGVAISGHVGSIAASFAELGKPGQSQYYLVTTHRLLILHQDSGNQFSLVLALPRAAVARAAREGTFLQRGRVLIEFIDFSRIAVNTAMFTTSRAEALAAALAGR